MITYIFLGFQFQGKERREAHVERFPLPTTRIMIEKRTASRPRVDVIYAGDQGGLWYGLLEHKWFERGLEAQQRRKTGGKRDINHLKQETTWTRAREEEVRDNNLKGRKIKTCFLYTVLMFNSSEARMGRGLFLARNLVTNKPVFGLRWLGGKK
jgi:hypothetical protein